jgi:hypothetical protein
MNFLIVAFPAILMPVQMHALLAFFKAFLRAAGRVLMCLSEMRAGQVRRLDFGARIWNSISTPLYSMPFSIVAFLKIAL